MVLCELCNRIPVNAHQYKHQPDYESLLESAKTCELCRLIDQVCERNSQRKRAEEYRETIDGKYMLVNDTSITISEGSHQKDPEAEPKQAWRLVVTCGPTIRADFGGRKVVNAQAYGIAIYADEG